MNYLLLAVNTLEIWGKVGEKKAIGPAGEWI